MMNTSGAVCLVAARGLPACTHTCVGHHRGDDAAAAAVRQQIWGICSSTEHCDGAVGGAQVDAYGCLWQCCQLLVVLLLLLEAPWWPLGCGDAW